MIKLVDTTRLTLRHVEIDDAAFYLRLVNEPSWLQFIGDKGVRTLADARQSILNGPVSMQQRLGFSLYLAALKGSGVPIGLCGLVKRDSLPDIDIGFAFLPEYWGMGYAHEAASAVMDYAAERIGAPRLLAIVAVDNIRSIRLIERLGLTFEGYLGAPDDADRKKLFFKNFDSCQSAPTAY